MEGILQILKVPGLLPTLGIVVILLIMAIVVISNNPKVKVNQYFSLFVFFFVAWIVSNYLENRPDLIGYNN